MPKNVGVGCNMTSGCVVPFGVVRNLIERGEPLATSEIRAGICGFTTRVHARMEGDECVLSIQSECASIQRMGAELTAVDPMREISWRGSVPQVMEAAERYCKHAACPVPSGVIKAIEVAAGLALPASVEIHVTADE